LVKKSFAELQHSVAMLDMGTDVFAVPGTRTTGVAARDFLLVAPTWHGDTPDGVDVIIARTPGGWVMGRTQSNGPDNYPVVHAIQDGHLLTPLSHWGADPTPARDAATDPEVDDETAPLHLVKRHDPGGSPDLRRRATQDPPAAPVRLPGPRTDAGHGP
jgi:hypothetical protein